MQDEKRRILTQSEKIHIKIQAQFFPKNPIFFIPIIHFYALKQRKIRQENPWLVRFENSLIYSLVGSKNIFLSTKRKTENNKAFQNKSNLQ